MGMWYIIGIISEKRIKKNSRELSKNLSNTWCKELNWYSAGVPIIQYGRSHFWQNFVKKTRQIQIWFYLFAIFTINMSVLNQLTTVFDLYLFYKKFELLKIDNLPVSFHS